MVGINFISYGLVQKTDGIDLHHIEFIGMMFREHNHLKNLKQIQLRTLVLLVGKWDSNVHLILN